MARLQRKKWRWVAERGDPILLQILTLTIVIIAIMIASQI